MSRFSDYVGKLTQDDLPDLLAEVLSAMPEEMVVACLSESLDDNQKTECVAAWEDGEDGNGVDVDEEDT